MRHGKYPFIIGFLVVPVTLYVTFVVVAVRPGVPAVDDELARAQRRRRATSGWTTSQRLLEDDMFWKAVRHHGHPAARPAADHHRHRAVLRVPAERGRRQPRRRHARGLGVEVLPGGVLLPPGPRRRHRRRHLRPGVRARTSSGLINGVLDRVRRRPGAVHGRPEPGAVVDHRGAGLAGGRLLRGAVLRRHGARCPQDIYEAAALDGASRVALFFRVTLPLLWDTLQVAWVYLGIAAFDAFAHREGACRSTEGGPDGATTVLGLEIYRNAFGYCAVRLRLGDGRRAVLPDHHVRRADPAGHPARDDRAVTGRQR